MNWSNRKFGVDSQIETHGDYKIINCYNHIQREMGTYTS